MSAVFTDSITFFASPGAWLATSIWLITSGVAPLVFVVLAKAAPTNAIRWIFGLLLVTSASGWQTALSAVSVEVSEESAVCDGWTVQPGRSESVTSALLSWSVVRGALPLRMFAVPSGTLGESLESADEQAAASSSAGSAAAARRSRVLCIEVTFPGSAVWGDPQARADCRYSLLAVARVHAGPDAVSLLCGAHDGAFGRRARRLGGSAAGSGGGLGHMCGRPAAAHVSRRRYVRRRWLSCRPDVTFMCSVCTHCACRVGFRSPDGDMAHTQWARRRVPLPHLAARLAL